MTKLTDEAVKALLDEMTFAMFGDGTDDTISEKLARALLDARAEHAASLIRINAEAVEAVAQALAPADGLAAVDALRERAEKAEQERRMIVSHATMGNTDGEGMSVNDVSVQITALRNELYLEAKADRDTLAAANAALEAKVAGLVDAARPFLKTAVLADSASLLRAVNGIRAALATQEAGNAQPGPPISPEQAQFNAIRHHERFGPLDEKGNPLDPRRRG